MKPKKNLFIRVPKTASTSISRIKGIVSKNHVPLKEIDWKLLQNSYTFSCVRHPYDRFISAFYFIENLKEKSDKEPKKVFKDIHECIDRIYQGELSKKNLNIVYRDQWDFVSDNRDLIGVNYLMKYENLFEDWLKVSKEIFGTGLYLPQNNITENRPPVEILTEEDKRRLNEIYKIDFNKFGY